MTKMVRTMKVGDKVLIKKGTWKGHQGIIKMIDGNGYWVSFYGNYKVYKENSLKVMPMSKRSEGVGS